MSRWRLRYESLPKVLRRGRRAGFCRRRLKAGAAQRATRLGVRCGLHGHRGRPRGLQPWPCGRSRRSFRACGRRASFLNIHVHLTHATSQKLPRTVAHHMREHGEIRPFWWTCSEVFGPLHHFPSTRARLIKWRRPSRVPPRTPRRRPRAVCGRHAPASQRPTTISLIPSI